MNTALEVQIIPSQTLRIKVGLCLFLIRWRFTNAMEKCADAASSVNLTYHDMNTAAVNNAATTDYKDAVVLLY